MQLFVQWELGFFFHSLVKVMILDVKLSKCQKMKWKWLLLTNNGVYNIHHANNQNKMKLKRNGKFKQSCIRQF